MSVIELIDRAKYSDRALCGQANNSFGVHCVAIDLSEDIILYIRAGWSDAGREGGYGDCHSTVN